MARPVAETRIDPILMEVVRYKLESIAEEMQFSLIRGSYSPIVKEAQDASCCVFQPNGEVVVQSRSNPSRTSAFTPSSTCHRIR